MTPSFGVGRPSVGGAPDNWFQRERAARVKAAPAPSAAKAAFDTRKRSRKMSSPERRTVRVVFRVRRSGRPPPYQLETLDD